MANIYMLQSFWTLVFLTDRLNKSQIIKNQQVSFYRIFLSNHFLSFEKRKLTEQPKLS